MNDNKSRADIERARQFRQWCEGSEGLYAVFAAVEKEYLETLIGSDIADHPLREKVYQRINALRDITKLMKAAITQGATAQAIIDQMAKIEAKKKVKA